MREFATIFLALIFETTPFLLAGVVVSVAAGPLIERVLATAAMRQPALGMAAGAGAGMLFPMCDCGSRPLAHRLALAGRRHFAVAFLVASPVINPIVIVTTWLAFRDPDLVGLRIGSTVLIAFAVAIVLGLVRRDIALPVSGRHHEAGDPSWRSIPERTIEEFFELFRYLVVGAALAACVQVFVDQSLLTSTHGVYISIVAMMALASLLGICSSVDAFVVAGFGGAMGTGPILAFLVFGPLVNLKSAPMYLRLFTMSTVVVLTLVTTQLAFVAAVVVELRAW